MSDDAEKENEIPEGEARGKTILVIEDDPSIRTSISLLLRRNEFQVLTASEWTEALDVLQAERPDLILLDLVMPVIDGVKLLQYIREQGIAVPVIVVSASIDTSVREVLSGLAISAFIAKPFRTSVLLREIWRALEPPLFLGEVKYREGGPVIVDEIDDDPTRRRRRRRRRSKRETPFDRALRRWRKAHPLLHPILLIAIGLVSVVAAWLLR